MMILFTGADILAKKWPLTSGRFKYSDHFLRQVGRERFEPSKEERGKSSPKWDTVLHVNRSHRKSLALVYLHLFFVKGPRILMTEKELKTKTTQVNRGDQPSDTFWYPPLSTQTSSLIAQKWEKWAPSAWALLAIRICLPLFPDWYNAVILDWKGPTVTFPIPARNGGLFYTLLQASAYIQL